MFGDNSGAIALSLANLPLSYCVVSQGTGQNFTSGTLDAFVFDALPHIGGDFSSTIGNTHVTINRAGMYFALATAYLNDGAMSGVAWNAFNGTASLAVHGFSSATAAELLAGQGLFWVALLTAIAGDTIGFSLAQTDAVSHNFGGDMAVIRLGS